MVGYWLFWPIYGYRYEKVDGHGKMLVPDGQRAKLVRDVFEGLAAGRIRSAGEVKCFLEEVSEVDRNEHGEIRGNFVTEVLRRPLYAGLI